MNIGKQEIIDAVQHLWESISKTKRKRDETKSAMKSIIQVLDIFFDDGTQICVEGLPDDTNALQLIIQSMIKQKQILEETLLALKPGDKQSLQPNQSLVGAEDTPQQPFTCRTNPQELFAMLMKEHSPEFFSVFELNNEVKAVIFADKKSDIGIKISNTINKFDPNISIEFETLPSK